MTSTSNQAQTEMQAEAVMAERKFKHGDFAVITASEIDNVGKIVRIDVLKEPVDGEYQYGIIAVGDKLLSTYTSTGAVVYQPLCRIQESRLAKINLEDIIAENGLEKINNYCNHVHNEFRKAFYAKRKAERDALRKANAVDATKVATPIYASPAPIVPTETPCEGCICGLAEQQGQDTEGQAVIEHLNQMFNEIFGNAMPTGAVLMVITPELTAGE